MLKKRQLKRSKTNIHNLTLILILTLKQNHMKRLSFIILVCIGAMQLAQGQTKELSGFKTFSSRAISSIRDGKEVKGYTVFYKSDKADKKNDNYHIAVYDENLEEVKTLNLQKPRDKFMLVGNAYNGQLIAFCFYNGKEKKLEYEAYDMGLVKKASAIKPHELSNVESATLTSLSSENEKDQGGTMGVDMNLHAVNGKGFVSMGYLKNGRGYTIEMRDNDLKKKWEYESEKDGDDYQGFMLMEVTDKYIIGNLAKRPGLMSKKMTFYIAVFDVETGKKIA